MIAEVIVNSSANELNRIFDYEVPDGFIVGENIEVGYRVLVSFARRKQLEIGYIIGFKEVSEYRCKVISKVLDVAFSKEKIELAKWMAKRYFCNLADIFKLLVPPGTSNRLDKVKPKTERWVRLSADTKENYLAMQDKFKTEKQKKIVNFLLDNVEIPVEILLDATGITAAVLKTLENKGVVEFFEMEVLRNPFFHKHIIKSEPLMLTEEQKNVKSKVCLDKFGEYLLHGVTGSGKTELYLQWIDEVIKNGKTAIVLVPEISLTPQITDRFLARFGRIIAILHSKLSQGERYDEWRRIQKGEAKIVIGARSALFAPIQNVGIIIIDEEHDASYKSETTPKYDAREVARKMAEMNEAVLVLGSATPDVKTYYKATTKKEIELLELKERISKNGLPAIKIVDLREELASRK